MDLLCLEHLDFNQGFPDICGMDVLNAWIPDTPTGPMAVTDPLSIKKPAPKETDWEEKKPTIEYIYLTENQTLSDTMTCMREQHGFTATEKMYKRHFRLWGWYKYTTKALRKENQLERHEVESDLYPTGACEPPRKKARVQEEPICPSKAAVTTNNLIPVDLKNFQHKAAIFTGIKKLLDSHVCSATPSPGSCSSTKYRLLQERPASKLLDRLYETLKALECGEALGWEAIKRILDQVQHHIKEDDATSFAELCFLVPRALLFSTQRRALRLYLSRLAHIVQEKNIQGPFVEVARLLQDVYKAQKDSGLLELLVFASSVFAAELVEKYGKEDRKALLATWDSLRIAEQLEPAVVSIWLEQWERLHSECMSRFGRHGLLTLSLEDDLAGLVQPTRLYSQASCPEEIGGLINGVRRKLFLIPDEDSGSTDFEDDNLWFGCT